MKRIIALILSVLMACSVFAGCHSSEVSAPTEEVVETVTIPEGEPIITEDILPEN